MAERPTAWAVETAIKAVLRQGGCAAVSDNQHQICIMDKGHDGRHGWEFGRPAIKRAGGNG